MIRSAGIRSGARGGLLTAALAASAWAGTFGRIVPIGGNASDLVLDEPRGVLYIANFTANRIEVMNTSDLTIARSINVNPQPGGIALSPDGKYLVVTHYGNFTAPLPQANGLTVLNLTTGAKDTYSLGFSPLGVAFGNDGQALIMTTNDFLLFDPASGGLRTLDTVAGVIAKAIPQPAGTLPPNITTGSVAASGNGFFIHGLSDQVYFTYDVQNKYLNAGYYSASPTLGPRVTSVSRDGYLVAEGWGIRDVRSGKFYEFPNPGGALSVGTHVIDSVNNLIYAQIPEQPEPPPAPTSTTSCLPDGRCITITNAPTTTTSKSKPPTFLIADLDNLSVREQLLLAENLGGRSVLNTAADTMYAISESGVTVFPVGRNLRNARRVASSVEDVVFRSNGCDRKVVSQEITISDPGGGKTDFTLTALGSGVSVSPSSGVTPAKVRVWFDPVAFQNQKGTTTIPITLTTVAGANLPQTIRLLVNSHDPDQRGAFVNVPGKLGDILADPAHDRYFVLRQDKYQVLVFDAATNKQIASLRAPTTPTQLAITADSKWLLIGSNDAQHIVVYDLDTLKEDLPIIMPGGHYPRSIAVSGRSILAASRVAGPKHKISKVDILTRRATELATLGVWENNVNIDTVLVATPNGSAIMGMMPDGNVLLYDANADTFTISRKNGSTLSGGYAASNYGQFVVGNALMNSSLVPATTPLGAASSSGAGISAGFVFVDQLGYRTSSVDAGGTGVIEKVDLTLGTSFKPTRTVESPLFVPGPASTTTTVPTITPPVVNNLVYATAFSRTLTALVNRAELLSLSQSGFTIIPLTYDAAVPIPRITRIVNAADQTKPVAPGGLISVQGTNLSLLNVATQEIPIPTALGESCLAVNGTAIPLVLVSSTQINAQLPFNVDGNSQVVLRTPGGISDNLNITILPNAPSVFRTAAIGGDSPTILRADNNELVSDSNPVRAGDGLVIYATGLGRTSPAVETGEAAPSEPLALANTQPDVSLDGAVMAVDYAGLTPGGVGVYQINVRVPGGVKAGSNVPLTIRQGGMQTTVTLQVAE